MSDKCKPSFWIKPIEGETPTDNKAPMDINKYRKGLVCLVPKEGAECALTSHEYSLCDCKVLEIFSYADKLQQELDAARADAKKNQIILDNLRDAPYWELEKALANAKAQIAELVNHITYRDSKIAAYEAALEKIAEAERMGYGTQRTYGEMAQRALEKWSGK